MSKILGIIFLLLMNTSLPVSKIYENELIVTLDEVAYKSGSANHLYINFHFIRLKTGTEGIVVPSSIVFHNKEWKFSKDLGKSLSTNFVLAYLLEDENIPKTLDVTINFVRTIFETEKISFHPSLEEFYLTSYGFRVILGDIKVINGKTLIKAIIRYPSNNTYDKKNIPKLELTNIYCAPDTGVEAKKLFPDNSVFESFTDVFNDRTEYFFKLPKSLNDDMSRYTISMCIHHPPAEKISEEYKVTFPEISIPTEVVESSFIYQGKVFEPLRWSDEEIKKLTQEVQPYVETIVGLKLVEFPEVSLVFNHEAQRHLKQEVLKTGFNLYGNVPLNEKEADDFAFLATQIALGRTFWTSNRIELFNNNCTFILAKMKVDRTRDSERNLLILSLCHEIVHVLQLKYFNLWEKLRIAKTPQALGILILISEVHAVLVTEEAAKKLGLFSFYKLMLESRKQTEEDTEPDILLKYVEPAKNWVKEVITLGGIKQLQKVFENPPEDPDEFFHPEKLKNPTMEK